MDIYEVGGLGGLGGLGGPKSLYILGDLNFILEI